MRSLSTQRWITREAAENLKSRRKLIAASSSWIAGWRSAGQPCGEDGRRLLHHRLQSAVIEHHTIEGHVVDPGQPCQHGEVFDVVVVEIEAIPDNRQMPAN